MGIIMDMLSLKKIAIGPEILNLVAELDEFKGRWMATQALAPERLAALKQVATIESVGSSTRIEGVKLTNSEIEALLRGIRTFSFKSRDEQEVAGYSDLMETIFSSFKEIPLSENHIKQLHGILLKYSTKDERHRGEYKKFPNHVEAFGPDGKSKGIIFQTVSPFETPARMSELVEWTNEQINSKYLHPLLVVSIFVVEFLAIHPFQDGNGRLSRALTSLLLLRLNYTYVPYSSFERVIEENKQSYYLALRAGQSEEKKGIGEWILFFLRSMQKQKIILEQKISLEFEAQSLPALSLQIMDLIKSRGPTSISEIVSVTKGNRNTIKIHLKNLVKQGLLVLNGVGRGVRYRLK